MAQRQNKQRSKEEDKKPMPEQESKENLQPLDLKQKSVRKLIREIVLANEPTFSQALKRTLERREIQYP
jgi:hypothetical protein